MEHGLDSVSRAFAGALIGLLLECSFELGEAFFECSKKIEPFWEIGLELIGAATAGALLFHLGPVLLDRLYKPL